MGRQLRRVPLDFDWPLNKPWSGFINPHYRKCQQCEAGYSAAYSRVAKHVNALMWDRAAMTDPSYGAITTYLAGRSATMRPIGHDSLDAWSAVKRLGKLAKLPASWTRCAHCNGEGMDPSVKAEHDKWKEYEPPAGDGWQMWETVSEGSPISPVCATAEDLARWLADNDADGTSYDDWLAMITGGGWAPSMVMIGGVVMSGVTGLRASGSKDGE